MNSYLYTLENIAVSDVIIKWNNLGVRSRHRLYPVRLLLVRSGSWGSWVWLTEFILFSFNTGDITVVDELLKSV